MKHDYFIIDEEDLHKNISLINYDLKNLTDSVDRINHLLSKINKKLNNQQRLINSLIDSVDEEDF